MMKRRLMSDLMVVLAIGLVPTNSTTLSRKTTRKTTKSEFSARRTWRWPALKIEV
jgi:hypothetical protein